VKRRWTRYVGMYYSDSGHRADTVCFRYKWQALLFHTLLNMSISHNGKREY
jgi:hypothetical protein